MFTFTRHQCRVTAFTLLALFVSAMGLLGVCAVWCGPAHGPGGGAVIVASASAPANQHSCCAKKAAADEARKPSPKKAECCTHEKVAKLAAVPDGPLVKLLADDAPALGLPPGALAWEPVHPVGAWDRTQPVRLVPPRHLPPKIPDLRVFLHSLTV